MRALRADVVDAIWETIEPLIPTPTDDHPLGCHRRRVPDRLCFWGILVRLVTGSSWVTVEILLDYQVSDTTLRTRRDEWIAAGVFDELRDHALEAYERIIGLDLTEVTLNREWAAARLWTSNQQRQDDLDRWLHQYNHHRYHSAVKGAPITRVNNLREHYN